MRNSHQLPQLPYETRNQFETEICHGEILTFNCNKQFNYIAVFTDETSIMLCDSLLKNFIRLFLKEYKTDSSAKLLYEKDIFIAQIFFRVSILKMILIFRHHHQTGSISLLF